MRVNQVNITLLGTLVGVQNHTWNYGIYQSSALKLSLMLKVFFKKIWLTMCDYWLIMHVFATHSTFAML